MKFDFRGTNELWLNGLLVALLVLVFLIDLVLPLGTAVWVIYLVPTVLSYLAPRAVTPVLVAAAVTVLIAMGFAIDRPGIDPQVAQLNRTMGAGTVWVLAITGVFFIRNRLRLQEQEWLQTGEVELARYLSGEISLNELGGQVTQFLADYMGARAAAFFARDGERYLRIGAYGVPDDAAVPTELRPGEGLLGQALAQGKQIAVDEVPSGHLVYGSALSRGTPNRLVLAPTFEDGTVNGAIELGRRAPSLDGR